MEPMDIWDLREERIAQITAEHAQNRTPLDLPEDETIQLFMNTVFENCTMEDYQKMMYIMMSANQRATYCLLNRNRKKGLRDAMYCLTEADDLCEKIAEERDPVARSANEAARDVYGSTTEQLRRALDIQLQEMEASEKI